MTAYVYRCPQGHMTMKQFPMGEQPESIHCEGWCSGGDEYDFRCQETARRFYTSPNLKHSGTYSYDEVK